MWPLQEQQKLDLRGLVWTSIFVCHLGEGKLRTWRRQERYGVVDKQSNGAFPQAGVGGLYGSFVASMTNITSINSKQQCTICPYTFRLSRLFIISCALHGGHAGQPSSSSCTGLFTRLHFVFSTHSESRT